MDNRKEFDALIERYESITIVEIKKESWSAYSTWDIANSLTGYGDWETCSLCLSANDNCMLCEWPVLTKHTCNDGQNLFTYDAIPKAKNPEELKQAFTARAAYMRTVKKKNK